MTHYQVSDDRNEHKVKVIYLFIHTPQWVVISLTVVAYFWLGLLKENFNYIQIYICVVQNTFNAISFNFTVRKTWHLLVVPNSILVHWERKVTIVNMICKHTECVYGEKQ